MRFQIKKVEPVKTKKETKKIKGDDWFPTKYPNIFCLAKKNSGKTTVVSNILDRCAGKQTKFIFICSTIDKDASWIKIVNKWEKTHDVEKFHDIMDEGVNVIQKFLDDQKGEESDEDIQQNQSPIQSVQPIVKWRIPMQSATPQPIEQKVIQQPHKIIREKNLKW